MGVTRALGTHLVTNGPSSTITESRDRGSQTSRRGHESSACTSDSELPLLPKNPACPKGIPFCTILETSVSSRRPASVVTAAPVDSACALWVTYTWEGTQRQAECFLGQRLLPAPGPLTTEVGLSVRPVASPGNLHCRGEANPRRACTAHLDSCAGQLLPDAGPVQGPSSLTPFLPQATPGPRSPFLSPRAQASPTE